MFDVFQDYSAKYYINSVLVLCENEKCLIRI